MTRLGAGADIVVTATAMEDMISAAEDGRCPIGLMGARREDGSGMYYEVVGAGERDVGMSAVNPGGGTEPDPATLDLFRRTVGRGVLVMVDPYAGEMAMYIVDDGLRKARAVVSERSYPDRVPVPHLLLGRPVARHEVADDAVEEEERGVLEDRAQGRVHLQVIVLGDVHDY